MNIEESTRDNCSSLRSQVSLMVGDSDAMRRLRAQVAMVAKRNCTVLIQGESGTGKELVAREIHAHSRRGANRFVPVDCTYFADTLFESQLFGHAKGAFTGAEFAALGFLRSADGGTILLDELGELALPIQAKLLRCIQERAVVPLGSVEPIPVNVRLVSATNRDLSAMVRRGEFREDLFYRLNVVVVHMPTLRGRRDDILLLADHFLRENADLYEEPVKKLAPSAQAALLQHTWPGNVRELRNAVEHAHVFTRGDTIEGSALPPAIIETATNGEDEQSLPTLEQAERDLIRRALQITRGNQARASRLLAVERHRLRRKLVRHGLLALANGN